MTRTILLLTFVLLPVLVLPQAPDWSWASAGGGDGHEDVTGIATDANGNVFAVGHSFSTELTFGSFTTTHEGGDNQYVFVVKLDPSGEALWIRTMDGPGTEMAGAVTVDVEGNCVVSGSFNSATLVIGDTAFQNTSITPYYDPFLVKFDPDGNVVWARHAGGPFSELARDLATDPEGAIYVVGNLVGAMTSFNGTAISPSPLGHIYYLKMDADGNEVWIGQAGSSGGNNDIGSVVTWASDHVYVGGIIYGANGTIGGIPLLPDYGNNDGWIAELNSSDGVPVWAQRYGGYGGDGMGGIAVDADGNAYAAGSGESLYFIAGGDTLITMGSTIFGYVVQFDPTGEHTWTIGTTGASFEKFFDVTANLGGGCAITGHFNGPTMGLGTFVVPNTGSTTTFVAAIDAGGTPQWVAVSDGSGADQPTAICADGSGDIFVGGHFNSSQLVFGDVQLDLLDTTTLEAFVAKLNSATGVGENSSSAISPVVFPNPVTDRILITNMDAAAFTVQLMDMAGRVVRSEPYVANAGLDVSHLARGMYQVRSLDREGSLRSAARFLKQ